MQLRLTGLVLSGKCRQSGNTVGTGDASAGEAGGLDCHGLSHDRAAVGQGLELGHGAAAGRCLRAGDGGRHGTQAGGRCLFHERAHGLRLAENRIHDARFRCSSQNRTVRERGKGSPKYALEMNAGFKR